MDSVRRSSAFMSSSGHESVKSNQMNQNHNEVVKFQGEEAGAGYASPVLDLIAALALIILSIVVMVASFALPAPGGVLTAPGLLPFLTAASLFLMALMLGVTALQRRAAGESSEVYNNRQSTEDRGALLLAVSIAVYIGALQFLAFQYNTVIAGVHYTISAFEPVTIVAIATIIQTVWRGPLWITTCVSIGWTMLLSIVFQKVFQIPLPGGF